MYVTPSLPTLICRYMYLDLQEILGVPLHRHDGVRFVVGWAIFSQLQEKNEKNEWSCRAPLHLRSPAAGERAHYSLTRPFLVSAISGPSASLVRRGGCSAAFA